MNNIEQKDINVSKKEEKEEEVLRSSNILKSISDDISLDLSKNGIRYIVINTRDTTNISLISEINGIYTIVPKTKMDEFTNWTLIHAAQFDKESPLNFESLIKAPNHLDKKTADDILETINLNFDKDTHVVIHITTVWDVINHLDSIDYDYNKYWESITDNKKFEEDMLKHDPNFILNSAYMAMMFNTDILSALGISNERISNQIKEKLNISKVLISLWRTSYLSTTIIANDSTYEEFKNFHKDTVSYLEEMEIKYEIIENSEHGIRNIMFNVLDSEKLAVKTEDLNLKNIRLDLMRNNIKKSKI